ncbi:MAG TPA: GlsB/YeaQ/YmgE family stress response membrane protein [Hyphomicrobiaceae bacterium]|nr:GlsB/YeaQ/YmgE family stress response membrane protein [Hyphomicrobiaceae bacterium]
MSEDYRPLIVMAVVGILAGWLASIIVGGGGLLQYLVSGVVGSFVGGYLMKALGVDLGIANPLVRNIVTATIGAIVVVLLARLVA